MEWHSSVAALQKSNKFDIGSNVKDKTTRLVVRLPYILEAYSLCLLKSCFSNNLPEIVHISLGVFQADQEIPTSVKPLHGSDLLSCQKLL